MADNPQKLNVIIFGQFGASQVPAQLILILPGGLNTFSRALAALLVPLDGEPLVAV
jgi:hypothetical protein